MQRTESINIFNTNIKIPPGDGGLIEGIFTGETGVHPTLEDHINYTNYRESNEDGKKYLSDFISVLFTEIELKEKLNEGFRGHPSIGSVVLSTLDYNKYPFKLLFDDLSGNKKPNDIRVFLVGSVFGGTGAAGFPTLGSKQIMKFHPSAKIGENLSQILLGGALVLPYFSFELDSEAEKTEKMFVTTNDFPIATKAALQYYNEKDLGFDQIYFLGDSLAQKVGKFGVGAKKQENFPHYIEIVSSLAAFDFYEQPEIKGEAEKMLFTAIRESEKLRWSDLPVSRESEKIREKQNILKSLMTKMTVFSYSYLTYGKKILSTNHKDIKDAWYLDYFRFDEKDEKEKVKDPSQNPNKGILDDFELFLNDFLFWISAMDDSSGKVELIDKKMLINGDLEIGKKPALINPENETTKTNIGFLLKNDAGNKGKNFNDFKANGLNSVELKDKRITEASSKFINIFYEGAVKYCKVNYNIN